MANKQGKGMSQAVQLGLIGLIAVIAIVFVMKSDFQVEQIFATDDAEGDEITRFQEVGVGTTLYLNSYNVEPDAKTEAYPSYTIYKSGGLHLDNAAANSSAGWASFDVADIYGTDTSYYTEPLLNVELDRENPTVNLDTHAIVTVGTVDIKAYDTSMTELSAAGNDSDYNITLGASQEKAFYTKIDTAQADKNLRIKAFCTFGSNQTDGGDLKIATGKDTVASDWTKVTIPDELSETTLSIVDKSSTITLDYDACYEYKAGTEEFVDLHEWEEYWMKWTIKAGSSDPAFDQNSVFGAIWVDYSYLKGKDNVVYHDWWVHDENEKVTTIGATETISSPQGLDNGFCIEAI